MFDVAPVGDGSAVVVHVVAFQVFRAHTRVSACLIFRFELENP